MGIFKRREKRGISQATVDALAEKYISSEADRLLASSVYADFVSWAKRNGLQAEPSEETSIPWQVLEGKKFRLQFFPVVLAGSDPIRISYFHVVLEDIEGRGEPMVEQVEPSLDELQVIVDGSRPRLD